MNSASLGDIVRTPTTDPNDFVAIKKSRNYKNINTDEVWSKSFTNHSHSDGGEWKVGIGKSAPAKNKKITVSENGHIISRSLNTLYYTDLQLIISLFICIFLQVFVPLQYKTCRNIC